MTRPPSRWILLALEAVVLVAALAAPGLAQEAAEPSESIAAEAPVDTAPVVIDGRRLFSVRGIPAYPAERRAETIVERVIELARDPSLDPATLVVSEDSRGSRIASGDRLAMIVLDADAELEGIERHLVAEVFKDEISKAIVAYRAERTPEALTAAAWHAAVATVLAIAAFWLMRLLFHALRRWQERRHAGLHGVRISSFEVVRADRIRGLVRGAVRVLALVVLLALVFFYLRYTLELTPWTRGVGSQLGAWVTAPLAILGRGVVKMLPNLIFLAIFVVVIRWMLRLIHLFFAAAGRGEVELKGFDPEFAEPTYKLVRLAVLVFAVVVAYPYIPGSSSAAFRGVSVFVGIVFSLGSSTAIANVIAGYTMVYRRAFREGDVIRIDDVIGVVAKIRLQVTQIRTPKNEDIIVPNATILSSNVVNYTSLAKTEGLILHTTVGIGYETPWRQVEAMLIDAARRTPGLRSEPAPFVLQKQLGDFAVTYEINVYCAEPRQMARLYAALHASILDVFNEHGVQIMTPAYEGDPEVPKVVPRDQWYTPPAARDQPAEGAGATATADTPATAAAASAATLGAP